LNEFTRFLNSIIGKFQGKRFGSSYWTCLREIGIGFGKYISDKKSGVVWNFKIKPEFFCFFAFF
jgi:hypothetical protein